MARLLNATPPWLATQSTNMTSPGVVIGHIVSLRKLLDTFPVWKSNLVQDLPDTKAAVVKHEVRGLLTNALKEDDRDNADAFTDAVIHHVRRVLGVSDIIIDVGLMYNEQTDAEYFALYLSMIEPCVNEEENGLTLDKLSECLEDRQKLRELKERAAFFGIDEKPCLLVVNDVGGL